MANIQESGEMYLEDILVLQKTQPNIRAIDIVNFTGYSKPSISRALGLLKKEGCIEVDSDGFITLTDIGRSHAQKIYERHTVLTAFFEHIGVTSETAAADACKIEHDISDETFAMIKRHIENCAAKDCGENR